MFVQFGYFTSELNRMIKIVSLLLGFILTSNSFANKLPSNKFCEDTDTSLYTMQDVFAKNHEPFHVEHLIRFSECHDEYMTQCEEFVTDKYSAFQNLHNYLQNDATTIDASPLKTVSQSCEFKSDMDELVRKSIHNNDLHFAYIG